MSAQRIDTSRVKLPGSINAPVVSAAGDQMLRDEISEYLSHIGKILEPKGMSLTEDETLPEGYEARFSRAETNNLSSLERSVKTLRAIRQELADRVVQRQQENKAKADRAREGLEQLVEDGPKRLQDLVAYASVVEPALERMRQFIDDVHMVAGARNMETNFRRIQQGTQIAADALGKELLGVPKPPETMPTDEEIDGLLYVIRGMRKGSNHPLTHPGHFLDADKMASQLKQG